MRKVFSRALVDAALADPRLVLLTGDHGYSLFDEFRQRCPGQYLNAGVAEQNMVGVAAGLAKGGLRPIVYGLSAFVPIRVLEQIKLDVCYENLPVTFIGDGAGLVYSTLGTSHQSTEDIAVLRAVPNLSILSPADELEMTACVRLAFDAEGPVYLRMGKADLGRVHATLPEVTWGEPLRLRAGDGRLGLFATGSMVPTALAIAEQWSGTSVWSVPSLKPLDGDALVAACRPHQAIVSLEEHSIHGGLGAAIAETLAEHAPRWLCRVGIQDRFSRFCGSYQYLLTEHRLDLASVAAQVRRFVERLPADTQRAPSRRRAAA